MGVRPALLMTAIAALWATQPARSHAATDGPADRHAQVDAIFAPWNGDATPGCAVGVARDGTPDHVRGYGMSNLEYGVAITDVAADVRENVIAAVERMTGLEVVEVNVAVVDVRLPDEEDASGEARVQ